MTCSHERGLKSILSLFEILVQYRKYTEMQFNVILESSFHINRLSSSGRSCMAVVSTSKICLVNGNRMAVPEDFSAEQIFRRAKNTHATGSVKSRAMKWKREDTVIVPHFFCL